ncbi:ATP-binding protein, partial [Pseudomaricurvus sp.]|uniref:ATP-binding protein n=1 Tax=Pseudomaricurvus sp. TaxID=2004510 RepID=UPI003F6B0DF4
LEHLATKISARKPSALDPIDQDGVPLEIQPVVSSLNELLDRLQQALISERRFTSNAAHELQTPLAAIKAEVQRSLRQTSDSESRQMLERIEVRVARAADTVTQMLTLARLDPEQQFGRHTIDLNRIVIDLMAEEGHLAADRHLEIEIDEDPDVTIEGHQDWIKILIRNLLNNAFKYTTAGGTVHICLKRGAEAASFSVANECEVISESQRQRLTDRFYSLPGREAGGVGLGLSIVERIADLHGATLYLTSKEGERSFLAEVRFPNQFINNDSNNEQAINGVLQ